MAKDLFLVRTKSLLFRKMKCIWVVTRRSRAAGTRACRVSPDDSSAPICRPVKTRLPAPKPTVPSLRQKLPCCCSVAWRSIGRFFPHLHACGAFG